MTFLVLTHGSSVTSVGGGRNVDGIKNHDAMPSLAGRRENTACAFENSHDASLLDLGACALTWIVNQGS